MSPRPSGVLRIIGGLWRSRQIAFDAGAGVRPTPDRVRQTLFDWLAPRIEGASCLDLFAGSGALGLEALSRGAGLVNFVETGRNQVGMIRAAVDKLAAAQAQVTTQDAIGYLQHTATRYEIVFLDPPYGSGLLEQALEWLPRVLKPENRIYIEWPADASMPLPAGYHWLREKQAGQVSYGLATYTGTPS
jgi:16S rRNA (guanine966-N2)-methyltransferase